MTGPRNQLRPEDAGARLRAVRELSGVATRDLARATGLSARELSAAERGSRQLSASQLRAVATALGVEPEVLLATGVSELDHSGTAAQIDGIVAGTPQPVQDRRREFRTRKQIEDSWEDVRSTMEPVVRLCLRVSTVGSGDNIRVLLDDLEMAIRRLKADPEFVRTVARQERMAADARSKATAPNPRTDPRLRAW